MSTLQPATFLNTTHKKPSQYIALCRVQKRLKLDRTWTKSKVPFLPLQYLTNSRQQAYQPTCVWSPHERTISGLTLTFSYLNEVNHHPSTVLLSSRYYIWMHLMCNFMHTKSQTKTDITPAFCRQDYLRPCTHICAKWCGKC